LTGILPVPEDSASYYLRGDGTWQPIKPPTVESEDVHTDTGFCE
jgi:hypothetical protein